MLSQTSLIKNNEISLDTFAEYQNSEMWSQLPSKVRRLLEYLHYLSQNQNEAGLTSSENRSKKEYEGAENHSRLFCAVFKRLSHQEQRGFLQLTMRQLQNRFSKGRSSDQHKGEQQYNCQMRVTTLSVPHWSEIRLRLNCKERQVTLVYEQRAINIYLRSKVHPLCFALEYAGYAGRDNQYNYHLKFKDKATYSHIEDDIRLLIASNFAEGLLWEVNDQRLRKSKYENVHFKLFLTVSRIQKFQSYLKSAGVYGKQAGFFMSDRQSEETSIKSAENQRYREVFSSQYITISCSDNDETLYRAQFFVENAHNIITNNILTSYQAKHGFLMKLKILQRQQVKKEGTFSAIYQKIMWKDKVYGQLLACREQKIDHILSTPTLIFSLMDIDDSNNQGFIQYLQVTAHKDDNKVQINIFGKFFKAPLSSKATEEYLIKFIEVMSSKGNIDLCASKCGNSLLKDMKKPPEEPPRQEMQVEEIKKYVPTTQQIEKAFSDPSGKPRQILRTKISNDHLKKRYSMIPTKQKTGVIMKDHFLWNNWRRAQDGGLVCKNEELVDRQKKMFKLVLKKFGETLIMGKNIINFSLPVVVFKKQSHLESIAKSYLYAPIFTEKAAKVSDPLQRMKLSIVLMITECSLSIHMEKPFNPILGETFQGWIDGCPIYLQQVSHHPPISAYYLVGRGYKKYGCIEPKISVGLNSGSGYSLFPHFVQFDDGGKIEYICAKICIGGLLIGQRTFNFKDSIYAYDRKNRFFASMNFGPVRQGFFSSSDEPQDYFHGYIYRVSPDFERIFDNQKGVKPHPQPQHIQEKLSFFDGIWSSSVNIDGKQVLNLKSDLPYEFTYEDTPLPSNSTYREDLSNLLAGDLEAAQIAKEQMEEAQRRDRRLREEYDSPTKS